MRSTEESNPHLENLVRSSRCYAGVGSRSMPRSALVLLGKIGATLAGYGLILRSGAAPGGDTAFERGCDRARGRKEIYLPWARFSGSNSALFPPSEQAEIVASLCHPNWGACNRAAQKLHARNCQQICGQDMESPVDFVVYWAPEKGGRVEGGTATAVFLAREMSIPTFNLWQEETREQWREFVRRYNQRKSRFWKNILGWLESGEGR